MASSDEIFDKIEDDTEEQDYSHLPPIERLDSECYKCDVGMCGQCRGDQYDYEQDLMAWYGD